MIVRAEGQVWAFFDDLDKAQAWAKSSMFR